MSYALSFIIGYLLGCFNTAYFISKTKGFDIRETGSGNAGASNIKISLGWKFGILTALTDILKAYIAVKLCQYLFPNDELIGFIGGAAAVLGHIFPFYLKFKGGKGYACYTGMLLAINYKLALIMMAYGVITTLVTNYIALATISTSYIVLIYYIYIKAPIGIIIILLILAIVITYKHLINIKRIIRKEEIGLRKKK